MTEETPIKAKPAKNRKFLLIRYGRMNNLGLFEHNETEVPQTPTRVVVKTEKGLELGTLVGQLSYYKDGRFRLSEEQVASYYTTSEIQFNTEPVGKVVRFATPDDISEEEHLQAGTAEEIESCERIARELGLRMKIIGAEHIFGGERVVFYFMAEGRVDFRELVRKLAQEYQTRIEMRQIGSRDEAKLLGDVESCGRECCCLQFLQLLKPVNMRMAKMQKATLDPSKISGYCGRLKCCLRYEDQTYTELKQSLPKKGVLVQTEKGEAKVIDGQILTQLVIVEYANGDKASFPVDEVTVLPASAIKRKPPQQGEAPANGNRRPEGPEAPAGREQRPRRDRDQRRPARDERQDALEERLEMEARDEQSDRPDEESEKPDEGRASADRRSGDGERPAAREQRPRRDRDQRRPPRDERQETPDERPETQAKKEQPEGSDAGHEVPDASRDSGDAEASEVREQERRPDPDEQQDAFDESVETSDEQPADSHEDEDPEDSGDEQK